MFVGKFLLPALGIVYVQWQCHKFSFAAIAQEIGGMEIRGDGNPRVVSRTKTPVENLAGDFYLIFDQSVSQWGLSDILQGA